MHRLNSNRVWSSQLKQTIARFDEKLATILSKKTSFRIELLTSDKSARWSAEPGRVSADCIALAQSDQ
jgi:hypothetical protein